MRLALYKGPALKPLHRLAHFAICRFTDSVYSHVELEIDGVCWTSSSRDGGVRAKRIDLDSGKWDVIDIPGEAASALRWFKKHEGQPYDWTGVLRFALPFLPNRDGHWFCSEAVASALGLPEPQLCRPCDLAEHFGGLAEVPA